MNFKVDISVCRVCMKSETGISLLKDRMLNEKFVYTTRLKVAEEDSMPVILCVKCVDRLKVAYDFCRLANTSEKHLRKFINKISTDFEEVTKTIPEDVECLEGEETVIQALLGDGDVLDSNLDTKAMKQEETMVTQELEMVEVPGEGDHKQENFVHEVYMEEFQEIIQEDEDQLYLDESSADDELQLYEDSNGMFEEEEESQSNIIEQQDVLSSADGNEEKDVKKTKKKTKKRTHNESAASKLEGKSNICIKCNKDFSTKTNLMRHMSTHDGVKPYQCTICGKGFTQNGSLKQHMFIHTGERPHVCSVCQRGFTQSKSLIFHMRRHTGEKPFTCEDCGISFRQKDGLKHHILKYHSEAPPAKDCHVCCICDRVLASKYSLSVHMKKHTEKAESKKPDLDFDSEEAVANSKEEMRKHTPQPQTPVQQSEISGANILMQATTYSGAGLRMKQFQCGKCFKSFHIKRNLLRHLRNHDVSSLELHECADCKIGFDTKRSLKLHRQRDHKDVISDLNSCEYCNAPYVTVADLSEHIATVHDAIEQDCPHCNEHFKSQKLYYDHLLEHEHMLED